MYKKVSSSKTSLSSLLEPSIHIFIFYVDTDRPTASDALIIGTKPGYMKISKTLCSHSLYAYINTPVYFFLHIYIYSADLNLQKGVTAL